MRTNEDGGQSRCARRTLHKLERMFPYNRARTCFGLMPKARLNAVEKLAALP